MSKLTKEPKKKKCKACGNKFLPFNSLAQVCSIDCAIQYAKNDKVQAKTNKIIDKIKRAEHKAKKESLKPLSKVLATTQVIVNKYIRMRDEGQPCISCGRSNPLVKRNAGHYIPVGRSSALRFNEKNIHSQCEHCNQYKSGNLTNYRIGLINKIGLAEVEALETNQELKRWSKEELAQIKSEFKKKTEKLRGCPR